MFGKISILALAPMGLALLAGALIPLQASSNGALGRELGHPLWAALTSLIVSSAVLIATIAVLRIPQPSIAEALRGPWWLWIGGFSGAVYVAMATFLPPKLGASNYILFVMVGQVIAAMLIDHFGLLGLAVKPVNVIRLVGILIVLFGLIVVQVGSNRAPASVLTNTASHPVTAALK
ncbi:DMT family transporter [Pseudomonas sp. NPDC008258]|uniref:DMT family transporter n=1 Tax=Pseudomonas sp. NPDC008258 TaxID=3364418 RepID=UPI0036EB6727